MVISKHLPKKRKKEEKPVELKWFQKQITEDCFEIKQDKKGKFYAHHNEWKERIWIGPYGLKEDIDKVIASYVSVTKKPFGSRKELKNVHSILIEKQDW